MAGSGASEPEKTERLIGSYRLVRPLGSGGMSSVFYALHSETSLEVAIKILPRNLAKNRTVLQRFLREAKSAEALEHPNIVAIYDRGLDDGRHYLVLEYVSGGDLHDWVRENGPMLVPVAISVIRSVSEALKFAAGQGLIHRDIKPANLLMTTDEVVKVADLGLALQAEAEDERVTREGTTVGTVDYMAPEQARDSRATSERSDIYSLGCTFFFLLTGQAPYAGGDVTEKLTKHFTAPVPNPRDFRTDVSKDLAAIVSKMMAKRPESRFSNYDELIAALDAAAQGKPSDTIPPMIYDAIVVEDEDEDEDEDDDNLPWPTDDAKPSSTPASPEPLYAIIDDDDSDDGPISNDFLPVDSSNPPGSTKGSDLPAVVNVSMAELAAMIDDDDAPTIKKPPVKRPAVVPVPVAPAKESPGFFEEEEEQALHGKMPAQFIGPSGHRLTDAEKSWLMGLVLSAVGLFVGVIAFHQLYLATIIDKPSDSADSITVDPPQTPVAPTPPTPETPKAAPKLASTTPAKKKAATTEIPPRPVVWTEPFDTTTPYVAEARYAPNVESQFQPGWAGTEPFVRSTARSLVVKRLADVRDADQKTTLASALQVTRGGTVEIADNGPFFEESLAFSGENRIVRGRAGYRPVICLANPKVTVVNGQAMILDLDKRNLILDGLDLIVDAKALQPSFASIFLCRGGSLTLRNCTVTVVNKGGFPFSVVQTGPAPSPSHIMLERSFIRGSISSVVDLTPGAAEVFLSRSVIVNSKGSVFAVSGAEKDERKVYISRCLLATSGPAIELAALPQGVRPRPLSVRSLGSTFVHLSTTTKSSLIEWRGDGAGAVELLDWRGDFNEFNGWPDWLSVGKMHAIRVPGLPAARAVWTGTDPSSAMSPYAHSLKGGAERCDPAALADLKGNRADVLGHVAIPTPWMVEKTLEPFPSVPVPSLATTTGVEPGNARELTFDTSVAPWSGDLGRFLAETLKRDDTLVKVKVKGSGEHPFTPVRVPDGVSLEIAVARDSGDRPLSWSLAGVKGDSLIRLKGGSLALDGVSFHDNGTAELKRWIVVEGGHLVIHASRLTSRGTSGASALIQFNASGSRPLKPGQRSWPFETAVERPTCRVTESVLISRGDVIAAEVGRGLVSFTQCGLSAGSTAFNLVPGLVARHRLDADLVLDHCTVIAERAFVDFGEWPGTEPGPDRPWLVSTRRCAFFSTYQTPLKRESVLLRVDLDAFAHSAVSWQGTGDAFEVVQFLQASEGTTAPATRPDVLLQWQSLWGSTHLQGPSGPRHPGGAMSRRLLVKPKAGDVQPGDFVIDPTFPTQSPPKDLGVDPALIGISATTRSASQP